jgi:hypothetical protein
MHIALNNSFQNIIDTFHPKTCEEENMQPVDWEKINEVCSKLVINRETSRKHKLGYIWNTEKAYDEVLEFMGSKVKQIFKKV